MSGEEIVAEVRRRTKGLAQVRVAEMLGVTQGTVSALFLNRIDPSWSKTTKGILRVFPDMLPFFLPPDIPIERFVQQDKKD